VSHGAPRVCEDCGSPLRQGQRYCLTCGARNGPRSPQLIELVRRLREPPAGDRGVPAPRSAHSSTAPGAAGARWTLAAAVARVSRLTLPSPKVSAVLVVAFLGFGVLLGNVAGSHVDYTLAASAHPRLKLLLPRAPAVQGSANAAAGAQSEPPQSSPEATPEAGAEPAVPSTPTPDSSSAGSSEAPASKGPAPANSKPGGGGPANSSPGASSSKLPPIKHVFVIMLSEEPYAAVFGPSSTAPYLAQTLERSGELLVRYYGVAHQQLPGGIALLSGQGPTPATASDCPVYTDIAPGTVGGSEQVAGEGCVYPSTTQTLAGQLSAKHLTWRAYVQGMDEPASTGGGCAHPPAGAPDPSSAASPAGQPYATFRNPLVYFHSVIDSPACASDDVGLSAMSADLAKPKSTPSLSYIVPDRCHDASPGPCPGGAAGGLPAANGFLEQVVPEIVHSKAYKQGGLLLITVDEAPSTGEFADSSSCCAQPRFPNLPPPAGAAAGLPAEGGGQVGALLLSPFVKPHTTSQEQFNHYSMLRTIEDLFGLKHLGYAGATGVKPFEAWAPG
jgi:hypothetical protein